MVLYEKFRPRQWSDVVGQDAVISTIGAIRQRSGLGGHAFWLSGKSGSGKTTIARLIAGELADDWAIEEVDAARMTPARLEEIERESSFRCLGAKGGRAYLVNEAHALNRASIRQLLVILERIPAHVVWIFTTTSSAQETLFEEQEDAHPLLSHCILLPLAQRDLAKPFAERCRQIAQAEGLDGQPIEAYLKLAKECKSNFRAMLQSIESGCMKGGA
jgi:replication-associated recombination protein RarA